MVKGLKLEEVSRDADGGCFFGGSLRCCFAYQLQINESIFCSGVFWTCHCFLNVIPTKANAVISFLVAFDRGVGKGTLLFGTSMDYDVVI